jgi:hypothetical protein
MYNELFLCFTDHFAHGLCLVLDLIIYMKVFYKQKIVTQIFTIMKTIINNK